VHGDAHHHAGQVPGARSGMLSAHSIAAWFVRYIEHRIPAAPPSRPWR
jgi:hypothetical protein